MRLPICFLNNEAVNPNVGLDRGIAYGDGIFETCRVVKGVIPLWELHLARLIRGASVLKLNIDAASVESAVQQALNDSRTIEARHAVLKIIVTRQSGGRGYKFDRSAGVNFIVMVMPAAALEESLGWSNGLRVRICEHRLGRQGILAGVKHLNRLDQVIARAEWQDEYDDGLMVDYDSNLIESISGNLLFAGEDIVTPVIDHCGVQGVMRDFLKTKVDISERKIPLHDLGCFQEILITNAVVGVVPVIEIMDGDKLIWTSSSMQAARHLQHLVMQQFKND